MLLLRDPQFQYLFRPEVEHGGGASTLVCFFKATRTKIPVYYSRCPSSLILAITCEILATLGYSEGLDPPCGAGEAIFIRCTSSRSPL